VFKEEILKPVGRFILCFGELETQLCELVAILCQCRVDIALTLISPLNLSQQIDTLRGLVDQCKKEDTVRPEVIEELLRLTNMITSLVGQRNTLVHGMLLKTDRGDFFVRLAGRPPSAKQMLPADASEIEKLADETLTAARLAHRLILRVQGIEGVEIDDITLPVVSRRV